MSKKIILIGHRGTRVDYEENTMKSFSKAIEYGVDFIEFDVHKTKDNKLIIIHDKTLQRTYNGIGFVSELKYLELKNFRTKKKGENIPLLIDVLSAFKNKTKFMIELKGENVVKLVARIIKEHDIISDCVISSKDLWKLKKIKSILPNCRICYNITKGKDFTLNQFLKNDPQKKVPMEFDMISLRSTLITEKFINLCHSKNILALSWDFINLKNSLLKIRELIKMNIDGLLFDSLSNLKIIKSEFL
jgi:glycerophosphoryl diester phosphodiesterase